MSTDKAPMWSLEEVTAIITGLGNKLIAVLPEQAAPVVRATITSTTRVLSDTAERKFSRAMQHEVTSRDTRVVPSAADWLPTIYSDPDFRKCIEECEAILATKGRDYTYDTAHLSRKARLLNFYEDSAELGVSPLLTWVVLFGKHVRAVKTFVKGQIASEPIQGRFYDCINYLLLGYKLVGVMADEDAVPQRRIADDDGRTGSGH